MRVNICRAFVHYLQLTKLSGMGLAQQYYFYLYCSHVLVISVEYKFINNTIQYNISVYYLRYERSELKK